MNKKLYLIFSLCIATLGWTTLFIYNWKVAGAIFLVIWANNISTKK